MRLQEHEMTEERISDLLIPAWCGFMRLLYLMFIARALCVVHGHAYIWACDVYHGDHLSAVWWKCPRCQTGTIAFVPEVSDEEDDQ
jgi:hypothetical protein